MRYFLIAYSFNSEKIPIGQGSICIESDDGLPSKKWLESNIMEEFPQNEQISIQTIFEFKNEEDFISFMK